MVLAGRLEAFEPLVTPHRGPLLALAARLTGNREEALDVVQEALLRAYRSLRAFDATRSFRNWLFQIAANEARDRGRRKSRERAAFQEVAEQAPAQAGPESGHDRRELRSGIVSLLAGLSPREREVFVLRDLEELDIRETSRVLGCSSLSVRASLSSARKKLRLAIRRDLPHLEEGR